MMRRALVTAALCGLLGACGSDGDGNPKAAPATPAETPCLADLKDRVAVLQATVDELVLEQGPAGRRGKRGKAGAEGAQGPAGKDADVAAYEALVAELDELQGELDAVESSLDAAETLVASLAPKPQELLNAMGMMALEPPVPKTCGEVMARLANPVSALYTLDADGAGPAQAILTYCDFTTDGGGYGWVRIDDASLAEDQSAYAAKCAEYGMEIVVPRTKAHALAIEANLGQPPNLVNVFPQTDGAQGLSNFTGTCQGQQCSFWLSDSDNGDCDGNEPSGDNTTADRLYRFGSAGECDYGHWNDFYNDVDITGWVVCSPNDK